MLANIKDRHEFGVELYKHVSPSQPIQTIDHLMGRDKEVKQIEKALYAPGRHIFIYGDRGVGKSSLAATVANLWQSPDAEYIDIGCGPDDDLYSIVANIGYQAIQASRVKQTKTTKNAKFSANFRFIAVEAGKSVEVSYQDLKAKMHTLSDAVEVLREVATIHSGRPVVVIDEFDRIQDEKARNLFADLIKHLGDKKVNIKFIFTGVTKTVEELLGAHQSAIRQLETIHCPTLSWNARWEIVQKATSAFGLTIRENIYIRIAAVSDGYPYYVHLITEKLLWRAFEDKEIVTDITWDHYYAALNDAINSIHADLKRAYDLAVNQRSDDYEEVLWSTADTEYLQRYTREMYSSYEFVMKKRRDREPLEYNKYGSRIRSLASKTCGDILVQDKTKRGLYTYKEKMVRGYVRLQAEAQGIELIGEASKQAKSTMHIPASASRGYYSSSVPRGVHTGRRR